MLTEFSENSHDLLFPKKQGFFIEAAGDALLLYKCKRISEYKILWDQKFNHTCYDLFPIIINNFTNFFELKTRRILEFSNTIKCKDRLTDIYIKDKSNRFWKFKLPFNFTLLPNSHKVVHYKVHLPKLVEFNRKLLLL